MKAFMVFSDTANMEGLNHALEGTELEKENYTTLADVSERLGSERSALVFCQARLPDGNFRDLLEMTHAPESNIAVVVCSEFYDERIYMEAMSMGAFDYVAFPFRKSEVEWVVGNAVRRKDSARRFRRTSRVRASRAAEKAH